MHAMQKVRTDRISILALVASVSVGGWGCPEKKELVKPDKVETAVRVTQPEEFYNQGVDALKQNDRERALASFREALSLVKEDPQKLVDAHYNIGFLLLDQGDLAGAQRALEETLKLKPDHRDALINLGVVLKEKKDYAGVIAHYTEALKRIPRDALIMNNLIVAYRLNQQYAEAEKTGHLLLARAPNNVEAYKNMTLVYYDQGKYEMAELLCINAGKMLEKQRESDKTIKDDPGIYNNLGMIYMKMGRTRDALAQFLKAISADPNSIDALVNIGAISHHFRDYDRAISVYQQVLKQKPESLIAHKGLAYAYFGAGRADQAIEQLKQVAQMDPRDHRVLFNLGECFFNFKHEFQSALQYYQSYKSKMGSALPASDPVNERIQLATAKLQMAEQVKKDEEEAQRKEEERRRVALEKAKEKGEKGKAEKKLKELLDTQEGEETSPEEGQQTKPETDQPQNAAPAEGDKEQEVQEK